MANVLKDLRYAVRGLARMPGFTAVALLTIAIGTGANTTVFSFVNALLLRPANGVPDASRLASVYTSDFSSGPYGQTSFPDFLSIEQEVTAFESLAAYADTGVSVLKTADTVERVRTARASARFFNTLGLEAAAGRLLSPTDAAANAPATAVIGHDLWRRAFGSASGIIGASVEIAGVPATIVGVAPAGFDGLDLGRAYDVWLPQPSSAEEASRGSRAFNVIGRLRPNVSIEQADAQVTALAARLARAYPDTNRGTLQQPDQARPMHVVPHTRLQPGFRGEVTMFSGVMLAAVMLVLLIACANVSALLLSRATSRARDIAVRLALGAGRRRLVRQFLIESVLLGCAGGALGLLFALWTADVLPAFFPPEQARQLAVQVDIRVVGFTVFVALLSSLVFGLAPALHATRAGVTAALRGDAARSGDLRSGVRLRRALVASQIALACVLLSSAAVLVQSLSRALAADAGFETRDAVIGSLETPDPFTAAQTETYVTRLLETIEGVPGVESATLTLALPFSGGARRGFDLEGYQRREGEGRELNFNVVTPEYFRTLGIPLIGGRVFSRHDTAGSERVAIVNQPLARRYFGGAALGRELRDSRGTTLRIVGVVGPGAPRDVHLPAEPTVYYPFAQEPRPRMALIARTSGDASALRDLIRRQALAVDARVPVFRVMTLESLLSEALTTNRVVASLVAASAGMAVFLALIGVYGVMAFGVARRAREIGVRMALGATARDVILLVVGEGLAVTLGGVLAGGIAAMFATRALQASVAGVGSADLATYVTVPIVLAVTAILAAVVPAWRALALEPSLVLRTD
jgi:predicted permease